jgi:phosphatidate cytidylyltransferase
VTDRNERKERPTQRRQGEGVRIIGAEEAQKAIDAGASGRRAEDQPRYGDVPPAPSGPRPQHRFPLPDSVDPAVAVPRPPVAPLRSEPPAIRAPRAAARAASPADASWTPGEAVRIVGSSQAGDSGAEDQTGAEAAKRGAPDAGPPPPTAASPGSQGTQGGEGEAGARPARAEWHGPPPDEGAPGSAPDAHGSPVPQPPPGPGAGEAAPGGGTLFSEAEPTGRVEAVPPGDEPPAVTRAGDEPPAVTRAGDEPPAVTRGGDEPPAVTRGGLRLPPPPEPEPFPPPGPGRAEEGQSHPALEVDLGEDPTGEDKSHRGEDLEPAEKAGGAGEKAGPDEPGRHEDLPIGAGLRWATPAEIEPVPALGDALPAAGEDPEAQEDEGQGTTWVARHAASPSAEPATEKVPLTRWAPPARAGVPLPEERPAGAPTAAEDPAGGPAFEDVAVPDPDPEAPPVPRHGRGGGDGVWAGRPWRRGRARGRPPGPTPETWHPGGEIAGGGGSDAPLLSGEQAGTADPTTGSGAWTPGEPASEQFERRPVAGKEQPLAEEHFERQPAEPFSAGGEHPEQVEQTPPEEGITVTGSTELPHWTEPPGGLPAGLRDPSREDDDLDAWNALGGGGVRWRAEHNDWDDAGDDVGFLSGDDVRVGALDQERSEHSDLYSFDEAFERLEEERSGAHPALDLDAGDGAGEAAGARDTTVATTIRRVRSVSTSTLRRPHTTAGGGGGRGGLPGRAERRRSTSGGDTGSRIVVGVGLAALLVIAYAVGPLALLVLALAAVVGCAAESYRILQHIGGAEARSDFGFRPATLLGLVATAGLMLAGYWKGPGALPVVLAVSFVAIMVWYLGGITDARPLANIAVTVMTVLWVGLLGSFAALMLREPHGKGLVFGAIVVVVVSDVVAFAVGRRFGSRPLAPRISPGKTVEGFVAGAAAAVVVGLIIGETVAPWGGLKHGLALGIVVAVLAPVGDLFESLIKRDLEVKDSGTTLAGHGGVLDRIDSILVVLPAAYYLATSLHLIHAVA